MKYFLLSLALSFLAFSLIAQSDGLKLNSSFQLSGKVLDSTSQASLPFATVGIYRNEGGNKVFLTGTTTSETGEFLIKNLPSGALTMHISFVGYIMKEQKINLRENLQVGMIHLQPDSKLLTEVVVKGEKDIVSMALDKKVFMVSKSITTVGGTAESLLRNIPSLTIGADGTAQLRNVTTTIYINGKPTQLSLAQIPANQIESVEVMTNPSAKYDASASSGIVNLVLKKNRNPGYTGTVIGGLGSNARYDGTLSLDYNRGKWNLSALYSSNSTKNPLRNYAYRTTLSDDGIPQSYFQQNTAISLNNIFQNARVAMDYYANDHNTITIATNYVLGQYNNITNQHYTNTDGNHVLTSDGIRTTKPNNTYTNAGFEFDWRHDFARKGQALNLATGFNRNWVSNEDQWQTTAVNADGSSQDGFPELDHITGHTSGKQIIAQLDYSHPVNDTTKWEIGLRSFTYLRDQQYFFNQYNGVDEDYILLPNYSQNAKILETVNALYVLYTRKFRAGVSMQAGLRVEQSALRGLSRFEPSSRFGYDYPSVSGKNFIKALFPSFSLSKKLNGESEIGISLSRKIGRPGWRQFFVGIQSSDRQNVTIGNPALQPEFVNTAELNYTKSLGNVDWISTLYYILEDNTIKPLVQPSVTDPTIYVTTYTNVKADIRAGFDNTLKFTLWNNLSILTNFNAFNVTLQGDTYKRTLWAYNAKVNLTYNLPANISAQLSANTRSRFPQLQGYRGAVRSADFALRKSFWNKKASIIFTINDIFNSNKQPYIYDQPTAYQKSMNRREVRFYKITVQLPLGRRDLSGVKKKDSKVARPDVDFSN